MTDRPRRAAAVLAALISIGAGGSAHEASFLDELGRRAYSKAQYLEALEHFMLVQQIAPSPRNQFNMALSAELAGRGALAYSLWDEYLAAADDDPLRRARAKEHQQSLARGLALVRVESTPPGATIHVDRRELGAFGRTPRTLALDPGPHRFSLEHRNYLPEERELTARTGTIAELRAILSKRTGVLRISGSPPEGQVRIFDPRGELVATVELDTETRLEVGLYRLRIEAEAHRAAEAEARVREGTVEVLELIAEPLPRITGRLLVTSGAVPARVLLDGVPRGTAPAVLHGLRAREYQVELAAEGYQTWRGRANVAPGKGTVLRVELQPR